MHLLIGELESDGAFEIVLGLGACGRHWRRIYDAEGEGGVLIDSAGGFYLVGFLALSGWAVGSVDLNVAPDVGNAIDGKSDDHRELIDK